MHTSTPPGAQSQQIDGGGVLYAIAQNGDLLFYRDLARDGSSVWANGGRGVKIGEGWQDFRQVVDGH